ncbi:MAG: ATP-dependent RecD-like DNA helicase [Anaerolineaceae bacterium]|nr:ATP-dependent RecD-like DNA helicase [Anaerolineaceae bacterium]
MVKNDQSPGLLQQELEGVLERITFQNEENGYTVAKVIPPGKSQPVTVVGTLAGAQVGESLLLQGTWINHQKFGRQFEVRGFKVKLPATLEGIRKYLGSGLIKGVGPATAKKIVDYFGLDTLEMLDKYPERIVQVPGIGAHKVEIISAAWHEQQQIKEVMLFLQSNGVSTSLAVKIYKQYGDQSIRVVRETPYQLARDIFGIGFKTADQVARKMGLPEDSPARIQTGLLYALGQLSNEGHCYATKEQLLVSATELLDQPKETCEAEIGTLILQEAVIEDKEVYYLPPFYYAEIGVAKKISNIFRSSRSRLGMFKTMNWALAFSALDQTSGFTLTDQQKQAVQMALTEKVSILTGGPGTGKSTITGSIIQLLKERHASVLLAAPTGRAAKRLSEATGLEAKTIHRLLEFSPAESVSFARDRENPLDADLIIIDETSMVDILLMNHLLNAVENGSHILFVGDMDQLPSVGPGNVLRDLIDSGVLPVVCLDTIFRQAEDSFIIVNAHRINHGEMPLFTKEASDFFLFSEPDAEKAADWVEDVVCNRIPEKFGFNPNQDIQVLTPMHRGSAGVSALNERLQEKLNPPSPRKAQVQHGSRIFREGDRVMQIRNDYDRHIFNGDLGMITKVDTEEQLVMVNFDERIVPCEPLQLEELVHAYAISIHKSQGSEFPVVVMPLLMQHYMMLQRNLVYTGVTRARKLVVMVGDKKAIGMAVRNNRISERNTMLKERLQVPPQGEGSDLTLWG